MSHTLIEMTSLRYGYFPKTFQLWGTTYEVAEVTGVRDLPIGGNAVSVRQFTVNVKGQQEAIVLSNDLPANTWSVVTEGHR